MSEVDPVGTVAGSQDPAGSPAPVSTEETVPKERFDGLMSTLGKKDAELQKALKQIEQLTAAAPAPVAPAGPQVIDVTDEFKEQLAEVGKETRQVFKMYRDSVVGGLLKDFPYATADDARGSTPEEWKASLQARHEQVAAIVDQEAKVVEKNVAEKYSREYGVPLSIASAPTAGQSQSELHAERMAAAKASGDMAEYTRLLLLSPLSENPS